MSILHTIINYLVVVLLKSSKYLTLYSDFNKALIFECYLIGHFFLDVGVQFLIFKISYVRFPD